MSCQSCSDRAEPEGEGVEPSGRKAYAGERGDLWDDSEGRMNRGWRRVEVDNGDMGSEMKIISKDSYICGICSVEVISLMRNVARESLVRHFSPAKLSCASVRQIPTVV